MCTSQDLLITTSSFSPALLVVSTALISSKVTNPSYLARILASTAMLEAVPPTWKVLSVSCVPGSPIDCAAMTPTASPICAILPVARFLP